MDWTYSQPVKIIFGNNKIESLYDIFTDLGLKNGLLVSDPIFLENKMADKIVEHSKGLLIKVFSDIVPNPTVDNVDACAKLIRENNLEFVVALGGGSSLDCAKAAASICMTEDSIIPYHNGEKKLPKNHLPLIAMPTTAGTGSEVTPVSVLSNPHIGKKAPLVSDNFYPLCAIVDPILTTTVPNFVTASTGLDVLAHALEGFWSKHHQPICDAVAQRSTRLVFKYLLRSYNDANDIEAKEKMCEASLLAGLAFGLPKTTGPHACSFPLTSLYHMPHGEACAFTLDYFTKINAEAENGRLNNFAKEIGFKDAYDMADEISNLKKALNVKTTLSNAGIKDEDIENLAKLSMHPNMLNNPVAMDEESLIKMYEFLK